MNTVLSRICNWGDLSLDLGSIWVWVGYLEELLRPFHPWLCNLLRCIGSMYPLCCPLNWTNQLRTVDSELATFTIQWFSTTITICSDELNWSRIQERVYWCSLVPKYWGLVDAVCCMLYAIMLIRNSLGNNIIFPALPSRCINHVFIADRHKVINRMYWLALNTPFSGLILF